LQFDCSEPDLALPRAPVVWVQNFYNISNRGDDDVTYKYPAGGSPIATLTAPFSEPIGAVQVAK